MIGLLRVLPARNDQRADVCTKGAQGVAASFRGFRLYSASVGYMRAPRGWYSGAAASFGRARVCSKGAQTITEVP